MKYIAKKIVVFALMLICLTMLTPTALASEGESIWDKFLDTASDAKDAVVENAPGVIDKVKETGSNLVNTAKEKTPEVLAAAQDGLENAQEVASTFQQNQQTQFWNWASNQFSSSPPQSTSQAPGETEESETEVPAEPATQEDPEEPEEETTSLLQQQQDLFWSRIDGLINPNKSATEAETPEAGDAAEQTEPTPEEDGSDASETASDAPPAYYFDPNSINGTATEGVPATTDTTDAQTPAQGTDDESGEAQDDGTASNELPGIFTGPTEGAEKEDPEPESETAKPEQESNGLVDKVTSWLTNNWKIILAAAVLLLGFIGFCKVNSTH